MNYLELTGVLFGIAGVWLTVKANAWCFPIGIVNVLITAYLVFTAKLYADALQQVVYFILLVYGWTIWSRKNNESASISFLSTQQRIIAFLIFVSASSVIYFLLDNYTDAALPFWDSTGSTICFIAQYLIAKKKIENWLLWLVANVMYIGIFYVKGMEYYSVLSLVYFVQAIAGWSNWRKNQLAVSN